MRDTLLPLAVSDAEYARWQAGRQARRRTALPVPGVRRASRDSAPATSGTSESARAPHRRRRSTLERFETDLAVLSGLDRYETDHLAHCRATRRARAGCSWQGLPEAVRASLPDARAEPGEHHVGGLPGHPHRRAISATTSSGPGSELRVDGTLGSDPGLGHCALQAARRGAAVRRTLCRHCQPHVQRHSGRCDRGELRAELTRAGADVGVNLGRLSDLRVGAYVGRLDRRRPGRRSRAAAGQGQGDRGREQLALRLAGQPGRPEPRHARHTNLQPRLRRPRHHAAARERAVERAA